MTARNLAFFAVLIAMAGCADLDGPETGLRSEPGAYPQIVPIDSILSAGQQSSVSAADIEETRTKGAATAARADALRNRSLN